MLLYITDTFKQHLKVTIVNISLFEIFFYVRIFNEALQKYEKVKPTFP